MKFLTFTVVLIMAMNIGFAREYKIYDTKKGKEIDIEDMVDRSGKFDVIFFGEFHDDSLVHQIQKEYLEEMYDDNDNITVSLEMFERDVQEYINKYLSGEITEEEMLENSRPWKDYSVFYKPLVELAKEYDSDVIAANIPRKYAGMYAMGGNAAIKMLPPDQKAMIAKEMLLKDDKYKTKFFTTMLGSEEKINELSYNEENTLWLYYGAQSIKDETMAESILQHFTENPDKQIIHFNGDFHSNSYLGTAQKLMERDDDIKVGVITPIYTENAEIEGDDLKEQGDFIIFLEEPVREDQPMNMPNMHIGQNYATEHHLDIEILPENSEIIGKDSIVLKNPIFRKGSMLILNSITIDDVKCYEGNISWEEKKSDDLYKEIIFTNTSFDEQAYGKSGIIEANNIVIKYHGKVYNEPSQTNLVERHSRSAGIISAKENEGIYLPGRSYYPATDKDMADFDAKITFPSEFEIITSGKVNEETLGDKKVLKTKTDFPLDDLILVGGRYHVASKDVEGVKINVYTYQESKNAEMYLNSLDETFKFYTGLFGEYPFESFSIVENFFSTGFGMPGYTLLGNRLMAMPWVTLSAGSLPHEFVHNWWGNSVFVDYKKGNWCEALTTFSTNYYYNKLKENEQGLIDWRKKALIAIDALPSDKNYPLADFEYQRDKFDAVIGYEKGAFMFYELYKLFGDEHFFDVLKEFASKYKGKRATWFSMIMTFSSYAKSHELDVPVKDIFNQWLHSTEVPYMSLTRIEVNGSDVSFGLKQDGKFLTKVPVKFIGDNEEKTEYFFFDDELKQFNFNPGFEVKKIQLDPDYQVLRKLNEWEKPYSFNRTLGREPIVIIPDKSSSDHKTAMAFVGMLKESGYDFEVKSADEVSEADYKDKSVLLLGNIKNNKVIANTIEKAPAQLQFSDNSVVLDTDKEIIPNEYVMLMNSDHPVTKGQLCTTIYYDNLDDVSSLARFFHYTSYSMVVLKIGQRGRPFFDMEIYPSGYNKSAALWEK